MARLAARGCAGIEHAIAWLRIEESAGGRGARVLNVTMAGRERFRRNIRQTNEIWLRRARLGPGIASKKLFVGNLEAVYPRINPGWAVVPFAKCGCCFRAKVSPPSIDQKFRMRLANAQILRIALLRQLDPSADRVAQNAINETAVSPTRHLDRLVNGSVFRGLEPKQLVKTQSQQATGRLIEMTRTQVTD